VRAGIENGPWQVSVFGQNTLDEILRLQTISTNEYFNPRRVLGIDIGRHFRE